MKRERSKEEREELSEQISATVKARNSEGRLLYPHIVDNPAFYMLQYAKTVFAILSERPLVLINLILTHSSMHPFWNQFPNLWPVLLERIISEMYSPSFWLRYPLIAYAFNQTLREWPFFSLKRGGEGFLTSKSPISHVEPALPFVSNHASTHRAPERVYYAFYNRLTSLFATLLALLSPIYTLFDGSTIRERLNDWWLEASKTDKYETWLFYSPCCTVFADQLPESTKHGSKGDLLDIVNAAILEYSKYTFSKVDEGGVYISIKPEEKEEVLRRVLQRKEASVVWLDLRGLLKKHLLEMRRYLERHPEEDSEAPMNFHLVDETFVEPFKETIFGSSGPYKNVELQRELVLTELDALLLNYEKKKIIEKLGSHYRTGLVHCGQCNNQSVTQADETLSIAFCNQTCLESYYVKNQIDLSSLPFF